jgi:hypothetical protein
MDFPKLLIFVEISSAEINYSLHMRTILFMH